jgi:hypothetical protein
MRSIANQSNQRTAAQAPVMNDCRITPAAYPTYETYETTSLRASQWRKNLSRRSLVWRSQTRRSRAKGVVPCGAAPVTLKP